ncbi:sodium/proton antiporter, NhaA family [Pseudopedobacter saltans DSM 12145]|uniref:Na(+)/H(+) antiporter NhaA n=1 Tax=Pseudopedobacter saltans (strain ATCC 51119 / DSM 12145 / JCM 21818 / CCUG 39354 / LMG 10337 / NBRC 100064 / NCIMB 13643) TaxID=762903 RepID=F0S548_PSESL|nr:Na+/H+ antiporter NhaA [Pseudopedobacter saltans]ADY50965.1 sodium/proton antiporter, NhaA family [Pseudopedobacter saltans DSM 12145]
MSKLINLSAFRNFFKSQSAGGIILICCVILSLAIANSPLGKPFENLLETEIGYHSDNLHLKYPILLWINDGLMAIFFLLVGLEIKRELVEGELSSVKKALLPIFAAIGGMLIPAGIYTIFNSQTDASHGWGIPMATDIAFAIAILSVLGNRVPLALKVFLTALAIVDDLGAIIVVAVFYTSELHTHYLPYIAGLILVLGILNYFNVKKVYLYLIPGAFLWYFVHSFGVHATIAGVVTAFFLPTTPDATESPLEKLEHLLSKPVNFLIMPLFAFANTNIKFEPIMLEGVFEGLSLGIILGLFLGKPIGITLLSYIAVKLNICSLPNGTSWKQIYALGILGGIGFTMSIFIALLSFKNPEYQTQAKFSILIASCISGLVGFLVLKNLSTDKTKTS